MNDFDRGSVGPSIKQGGARRPRLMRLAASILAMAVAGCTFSDDLTGQVGRLNSSIEQVQNEALLLNIVRAADNVPLSFTQLVVVRGSGTVGGSLGVLPTVVFGNGPPMNSTFGTTANATATTNTNFDLGILESKEFWLGLQRPISAETLDFFVREGLPRELLFYLFIQKAVLRSQGLTRTLVNDPGHPSFPAFTRELRSALALGLSTETIPRTVEYGPPLSAERASDLKSLVEVAKAGLLLRPDQTANGTRYQMVSVQPAAVMCFDPSLTSGGGRASAALGPSCDAVRAGAPGTSSAAEPFSFTRQGGASADSRGTTEVKIYARSTLDIIHFLGWLTKSGTAVELVTPDARPPGSSALADRLFVVNMDSPSADDFVSVVYRGTRYSIPMQATSTIRVFTLLRRLVALSTSLNALPVSNTVTTVVR